MAETNRKNIDLVALDYYDDKIKKYVDDKAGTGGLTIDTELSDTSENVPQTKIVKKALDEKADKTVATTTADGLMSAADKTKLDGTDGTYASKAKYGDTTINVGRKADTTVGNYSTAEGRNTTASGSSSHAEGYGTTASEYTSHAEGDNTTSRGFGSHAEGRFTVASGEASHAEGYKTAASGNISHAEGYSTNSVTQLIENFSSSTSADDIINAWKDKEFTLAHSEFSHAEGGNCLALSVGSHAEGNRTIARGIYSHAEGNYTIASGESSHAGGYGTKVLHSNEVAYGKYNKSNDDTLFSVGNGTSDSARHNAFEITTTGGKLHDKDIATTDMSLPANGGNADTLGGIVDAYHLGTISHYDIGYGNDFQVYCQFNYDASRFEFKETSGKYKIGVDYAANAEAVGGFTANLLLKNVANGNSLTTSINTCFVTGTYAIEASFTPDFPTGYGTYGFLDVRAYGAICYQTVRFENGIIINRAAVVGQSGWTPWKEISTTPIKSEILSTVSDTNGNAIIYMASENKKIISINCFAKQAVPFNYDDNQHGHFYENDGTPYVGAVSFCVYYIEG